MPPSIDQPPFVDMSQLSPELRELALSRWLEIPAAFRQEIASLMYVGWTWKAREGFSSLTHPNDEDVWVYFHPITFVKGLSAKFVWELEEAAGRGWWIYD